MDFGDILLLFFVVSGLLSSLAGGKKKKKKGVPQTRPRPRSQQRQPPRGRPSEAARPRAVPPPRPSLDPGASPIPTQMEDILRQLGLDVGQEPEEPEPAAEREAEAQSIPLRDEPRVVSLEGESLEPIDVSGEARHSAFRDKYIRPLESPDRVSRPSRARHRLNPKSLREAILVREILGPPKGLQ